MNSTSDAAVAMFGEGYNCAQSVLAGCGARFGLQRDTAIKLGQGFGGGLGCTGNVCGAVTGALMVVGLQCSARHGQDTAAKEQAYGVARQFLAGFTARHGSLLCRDLLGYDLGTAAGYQQARESGVFKTVCPRLVGDAAQMIDEVLAAARATETPSP